MTKIIDALSFAFFTIAHIGSIMTALFVLFSLVACGNSPTPSHTIEIIEVTCEDNLAEVAVTPSMDTTITAQVFGAFEGETAFSTIENYSYKDGVVRVGCSGEGVRFTIITLN